MALERVSASAELRSSLQLIAFLRFIVESVLNGEADRIKAVTIGTVALGRDASFDPKRDPIVRVEANRLRRALAAYYEGSGATDPIIIDVPRGHYVPSFRSRSADRDIAIVAPPPKRVRPWLWVSTGVAVVAVIAAAVFVLMPGRGAPLASGGPLSADTERLARNIAPTIVVEPIQAMPKSAASLADALGRELASTLAHVQALTVISGTARQEGENAGAASAAAALAFSLTGLVEAAPDGAIDVTLQLVSASTIVWARSWQIKPGTGAGVEGAAREAAADIARMSGVMYASLRARSDQLAPGYRCALAAVDYLRNYNGTQHDRVRDCLERSVAADPNFDVGFGLLAFVHEREYFHDVLLRPDEAPPLERSLQAAKRTLAIKPNSMIGHLAMMENHYVRNEFEAAFAEGRMAISLNPFDSAISGLVGLRMFFGGEKVEGAALLKKADSAFGTNPSWVNFGLFCLAYIKDDMLTAARYAPLDADSNYPYGIVARALVAAATGDRVRARQMLARLTALDAGWSDPRQMLGRFIRSPDIVDRLTRDLAAAAQP